MKLYNLVHAKTGYISPSLWKEALQQAKKRARLSRNTITWQYMNKDKQLEYISNVMAVWIINKDLKGDKGNEKV